MNSECVYERDILYSIGENFNFASAHIKILAPDLENRIPVIIQSKTEHFPVDYINDILRVLQNEIFDRMNIKLENRVVMYINLNSEQRHRYNNRKLVKILFSNSKMDLLGTDYIDE